MKLIPHHASIVRSLAALVLGAVALNGCNEVRVPGVYRIDIQQGNVITQEQLAALESGMEKRKVLFILGTPLVTDAFNQQRWDYYYSLEKAGGDRVQRIISVFFEGDLLSRVSGDVLAATGPIKLPERVDKVVTIPDGYRDEGLFASLAPAFLSDKPKRQPSGENQPKDKQGFLASLVPSFLSGKAEDEAAEPQAGKDLAPPAESTAAATPPPLPQAGGTQDNETATRDTAIVKVDAGDERYLRELLGDLGRELPAQDSAPASVGTTGKAGEQNEEEGLLSRWAKRFGFSTPEPAAAAPSNESIATPQPAL